VTVEDIAQELRVTAEAVKRQDVATTRLVLADAAKNLAQQLHDQALLAAYDEPGATQASLAEALGVSQQAVSLRISHALKRESDRLEAIYGGGS
jgi:DNA-binding MarR family transcriptional regulator